MMFRSSFIKKKQLILVKKKKRKREEKKSPNEAKPKYKIEFARFITIGECTISQLAICRSI